MAENNRLLRITRLNKNNEAETPFGMFFENHEPRIVVPSRLNLRDDKSVMIPLEDIDEELRTVLIDYLRLIDIMNKKVEKDGNAQATRPDDDGRVSCTESMSWLLTDYLLNGVPNTRTVRRSNDTSGRVNWKRTIQKVEPVIAGERIVFPEFICEKPEHLEDIISCAYRHCLNESAKCMGWIWNLSAELTEEPDETDTEEYISNIRIRLDRTFVDQKRIRLTHMLNILETEARAEGLSLDSRFTSSDYDTMYETMVFDVLGNVDTSMLKDKYYPVAAYLDNGVTNNLRTDAALVTESGTIIIDAKYYRESNLPAASDIMKQIVYAEHVEFALNVDADRIDNCFILPDVIDSGPFRYHTRSKSSWRPMKHRYESIKVIYMDFMTLFNAWRRDSEEEKEKLRDDLRRVLATVDYSPSE